jgi:hypothetical protein
VKQVRADDQAGTSTIRVTSTLRTTQPYDVRPAALEERSLPVASAEDDPAPLIDSTVEPIEQPPAQQSRTPKSPSPAASQPGRQHADLSSVKLPLRRPARQSTVIARPIHEPQVTSQARQALNFYGGNPARATLSQYPRRTPIQAAPQQPIRRQIKPFQTIYREPTVSPYLNLYRDEDDTESAPNFFAFVRPQQEQIEASRVQQSEIHELTRQLHSRSTTVAAPQYRVTSAPGTGTPARYRDTAQFYGGWPR